jgi:hypothetical protein
VWLCFVVPKFIEGRLVAHTPDIMTTVKEILNPFVHVPPQGQVPIPEAIERLVQLYGALHKKDEGAKWREELVAGKCQETDSNEVNLAK